MKIALVRRRGFTLIELLVVVAIIVLLATLSAGTYFRIYAAEKVRAANAIGWKLNTSLDRVVSAINDDASTDASKGNIPPAVMTLAGNDRDRARVIWTYLKLKNDLPTTFVEAQGEVCPNPSQLAGTAPFTTPDTRRGIWVWSPQNTANRAELVLKPRSVFSQLPLATTASPEEQSAACLYLALSATGRRGEGTDGDGLGTQTRDVLIGGATMRVYIDPWDTPIAFSRMNFGPEINTSDYVRTGAPRDPCDPTSRLTTYNATWTATTLNDFWVRNTANHIGYPGFPATYPTPGQNWVTSVFSAGPNKQWDGGFFAPDSDNIVSFRLRREGNRGD